MDIMMQLYDQEEIMRMHILSERRDASICTAVGIYQELGMSFMDVVDKVAKKFALSRDMAEKEVAEYWKE